MKKYYANEIKVSNKLIQYKGVSKVSDFTVGRGRNIKKLNVNTDFSQEKSTDHIRNFPHKFKKYVVNYVKKNPRVKYVVYATNMRLAKKVSGVQNAN